MNRKLTKRLKPPQGTASNAPLTHDKLAFSSNIKMIPTPITNKEGAMLKALKKYEFEPDYATSPGTTLLEVMEALEMTQKELAIRTELTDQTLTRIFKGNQPISYETANRLELVTQVPAGMWNNLEAQYREQLAKFEERQRLDAEKTWLKTIPT